MLHFNGEVSGTLTDVARFSEKRTVVIRVGKEYLEGGNEFTESVDRLQRRDFGAVVVGFRWRAAIDERRRRRRIDQRANLRSRI